MPDERSPLVPRPGGCAHYVANKRRLCSWPALPGHTLCGNHATKDDRIPCPLDGRHNVLAAELAAHLRVCNAAREAAAAASAAHLKPGCNGGGDSSDDEDGVAAEAQALALWQCREGDANLEDARRAVRAVADLLLASAAAPLPEPAREPECVSAAVTALRAAAAAPHATTPFEPRHAAQQAGILSSMAAAGLLPPPGADVVYAELGAGRGYLTHMLAEAYGTDTPASFLLVERRSYRNKAERSLRREASVIRLRCDITDLDLAAAPLPPAPSAARPGRRRVVAIAKHLCGAGTDAALRCASRCSRTASAGEGPVLFGLAIAPCCHHACRWRVFCGKRTLRHCGIGPFQFALASRMASWAVCPGGPSDDDSHSTPPAAADTRWGLSTAERHAVGAAAKQLFDAARADWATARCGGAARVVSYCDVQVSPEQRLLVMRADV